MKEYNRVQKLFFLQLMFLRRLLRAAVADIKNIERNLRTFLPVFEYKKALAAVENMAPSGEVPFGTEIPNIKEYFLLHIFYEDLERRKYFDFQLSE